ncbi:hypothetical protein [Endozoicomonas sp.]|uniref:hypothetical protein n=1 Tax=Endozoicomonas sp. TaxID=1892382 RepID=UPI00383B0FD1
MFRRLLAMVFFSLLLAGCNATQPIRNVSVDSLPGVVAASKQDVRKAITMAINKRGWRVVSEKPGLIAASVDVRDHKAVVDIAYSATGYGIEYRDSTNLNHKGNNIHRNYNKWVVLLDREIQQQLLAM